MQKATGEFSVAFFIKQGKKLAKKIGNKFTFCLECRVVSVVFFT